MDRRVLGVGPTWRQIFAWGFVALIASSIVLYMEVRHGVVLGTNAVELQEHNIALSDSLQRLTRMQVRAIARQDTVLAAITSAQDSVLDAMGRLARGIDRGNQLRMATLTRSVDKAVAKVDTVAAKVDTVASKIDSVQTVLPAK